MHLNFLCPLHRDWVYFHPEEALSNLENAQQKGELLLKKQQWKEAVPFIGCALESAEILLELQEANQVFLATRLTSLCLSLAECFLCLSVIPHALNILNETTATLRKLNDGLNENQLQYAYLKLCISALQKKREQVLDGAAWEHSFASQESSTNGQSSTNGESSTKEQSSTNGQSSTNREQSTNSQFKHAAH